MPFGTLDSTNRLGVSNVSLPNAHEFATKVLKLPPNIPIYQQQLLHSTNALHGPTLASAESCFPYPDGTAGKTNVLRQVNPHHHKHGRLNISASPHDNFISYAGRYPTKEAAQLFYICNEPEAPTELNTSGNKCERSAEQWPPPVWEIDSYPSIIKSFPKLQEREEGFWDVYFVWDEDTQRYVEKQRHINAKALAHIFLMVRNLALSKNPYHVVLPPAAAESRFGAHPDFTAYWTDFFNGLRDGTTFKSVSQAKLPSVESLEALHAHRYDNAHYDSTTRTYDPLYTVATSATDIRRGCDWYRDTYLPGQPLPLDYMLSEAGPNWKLRWDYDKNWLGPIWAGGFPNMMQGLSYWNSHLAWITRRAPLELNLKEWNQNSHVMYACIHEPNYPPYVIRANDKYLRKEYRTQWYFNLDAWATYVSHNTPVCSTTLQQVGNYMPTFPLLTSVDSHGASWHMAPFGACYNVWAQVGADSFPAEFGKGWHDDKGLAGSRGQAEVTVKTTNGWSTILIPFLKNKGTFAKYSQYSVRWHRGDGSYRDHGMLDLSEFPDTATFTIPVSNKTYNQEVYSAMVLPLIVWTGSNTQRTFKLELSRNISGPAVHVGRPIVLNDVACSWHITH
ncbi:MAG: hypothetical protein H0T73_02880 [Ardenticatenales bacterium]|nr:hypothetical protein [Ardenticatenales bacterium]